MNAKLFTGMILALSVATVAHAAPNSKDPRPEGAKAEQRKETEAKAAKAGANTAGRTAESIIVRLEKSGLTDGMDTLVKASLIAALKNPANVDAIKFVDEVLGAFNPKDPSLTALLQADLAHIASIHTSPNAQRADANSEVNGQQTAHETVYRHVSVEARKWDASLREKVTNLLSEIAANIRGGMSRGDAVEAACKKLGIDIEQLKKLCQGKTVRS